MSRFKLYMTSFFVVIIGLIVSGCGAKQTTVPDEMIEIEIPSIIGSDEALQRLDIDDYTLSTEWEIEHSPDTKNRLDTIVISFKFNRELGTINYRQSRTYQYFKNSDSWTLLVSDPVEYIGAELDLSATEQPIEVVNSQTMREGISNGDVFEWDVLVSEIDFETQSAYVNYDITLDDLNWNDACYVSQEDYRDSNHMIAVTYPDVLEDSLFFRVPCAVTYTIGDNETDFDFYLWMQISVDGVTSWIERD